MSGLIPIPNTRISGLFARQRLVQQFQADQLDLFRLQDQISTGQRIILPSDDAPAALRAITLQQLIERKDQLDINIQTGQSFLSATDTALASLSGVLSDIRGVTLGVAGTTSSDQERAAVVAEVNRAIETFVQTANRSFRGRYLFAGSQTNVEPYSFDGENVIFHGDDREVRSYSDLGVLFASNATGFDVFGGASAAVIGSADLNPQLHHHTLLSSLRGGRGISANGSFNISDGINSSTIDISGAVTVGDVVRLIQENPPAGRDVAVTVTPTGLTLQLDAAGGGSLLVTEVGNGSAARELGILAEGGVGTAPLVGDDLDPAILPTTGIDDLLGSQARALLTSAGANNDILIEAAANGAAFDGVTIQYVDDNLLQAAPGLAAGNEVAEFDPVARAARGSIPFVGAGNDLIVSSNTPGAAFNNVAISVVRGAADIGDAATANYDAGAKQLVIRVDDDGETTVQSVIDAIALTGQFTATHDASVEGALDPSALVDGGITGNTGNSGGDAGTLYLRIAPTESTANDVVAAINADGTFTATLDPNDTSQPVQQGTGFVAISATATTVGGTGTSLDQTSGIRVVNGGSSFDITFDNAETVEDLLNILNGSDAGLHAEINATGTGINVQSRLSGNDFQIGEIGGQTATQLGIRTFTSDTKLADLNYGVGVPSRTGTDFTIITQDNAVPANDVLLDIDISAAVTIGDVIDLINTHPANNDAGAGVGVLARLAPSGNGIELVDTNPTGTGSLQVQAAEQTQAAEFLGLVPSGQTQTEAFTGTLTGADRHFLENKSVFNTLIRLRDALNANDIVAIERAVAGIDNDIDRLNLARADVGARQQGLDIAARNLEDEDVQLRSALSDEIDVDLVEAISNLTARQTSLEASLRATANILQLSLLNFI